MLTVFFVDRALADYVCGTTDDDTGEYLIAPVLPAYNATPEQPDPVGWNHGAANTSDTRRLWSATFSETAIAAISAFIAAPPIPGECGLIRSETAGSALALVPGWNS